MRTPTARQIAIYLALFVAVFVAALLAMVGVTWVAMSWSADGDVAHGVRIVLALVVSAVVLNAMHSDRASLHVEHDTQLG